MNHVNLFGEPVDLGKHQPKKKKATRTRRPTHNGWVVKGACPEEWHKAMSKKSGEEIQPFYDWARHNSKTKASHKPCSTYESALEYKKLAQKSGWLNVHVTELKKGDISQLKEVMPV